MSCPLSFSDQHVEDYVRGRLDEQAAAGFEDHYFACADCLERVEALSALREVLAESSAAAARPRTSVRHAWPTWLAAAASVLLAVGLWRELRPGPLASPSPTPTQASPAPRPDPKAALRELGRFAPPAYAPETLRAGTRTPPGFEAGMRRYTAGDPEGAVAPLEQAVKAAPKDAAACFFLGVSRVLAGRLEPGIAELRRCVALGDTPFLEEAHLCLARALLQQGDAAGAAAELHETLRLEGDLEPVARELRERLRAMGAPQGGP